MQVLKCKSHHQGQRCTKTRGHELTSKLGQTTPDLEHLGTFGMWGDVNGQKYYTPLMPVKAPKRNRRINRFVRNIDAYVNTVQPSLLKRNLTLALQYLGHEPTIEEGKRAILNKMEAHRKTTLRKERGWAQRFVWRVYSIFGGRDPLAT